MDQIYIIQDIQLGRSLERLTVMAKILPKFADPNPAHSKFCMILKMHNPNFARSKFWMIQILHFPNFAWSNFCTIQTWQDPNSAQSKYYPIQIFHNPNPLFSYNFIYQRSIVMGCACLDMIRIFFLFFWGEITTVHKWQLGRKAKNSLRPEEQYQKYRRLR